jgi:hypothetical protein
MVPRLHCASPDRCLAVGSGASHLVRPSRDRRSAPVRSSDHASRRPVRQFMITSRIEASAGELYTRPLPNSTHTSHWRGANVGRVKLPIS